MQLFSNMQKNLIFAFIGCKPEMFVYSKISSRNNQVTVVYAILLLLLIFLRVGGHERYHRQIIKGGVEISEISKNWHL